MNRFFLALVLPMLLLVACDKPYSTAAKLAQDVAETVHSGSVTVDEFRKNGSISVSEERRILGYMQSINTLDGEYINCIQAAHTTSTAGGFSRCVDSLLTGIQDPETLEDLHVFNPDAQRRVITIVRSIQTLATAAFTALGGK